MVPVSIEARRHDLLEAAFRDVHAARLHGFALLVTLGDRAAATTIASRVMAEGSRRATELRHPERAAAWLRARVVRLLARTRIAPPGLSRDERCATTGALGAPSFVFSALEALTAEQRIAVVAGEIERFDAMDVATILGRGVVEAREIAMRARADYVAAALAAMAQPGEEVELPAGPIAVRVLSDAARTLGGQPGSA